MEKLTKSEIEQLEKIVNKENLIGRKELDWFVWANTTQPKYKVGDAVKVTERGHKICGEQVIDWNAKITKVLFLKEKKIYYHTQITYELNGVKKTSNCGHYESELKGAKGADSGKSFKYIGRGKYIDIDEVYI